MGWSRRKARTYGGREELGGGRKSKERRTEGESHSNCLTSGPFLPPVKGPYGPSIQAEVLDLTGPPLRSVVSDLLLL